MVWLFYLTAAVALFCTIMAVTRLNIVHALLYMVMALLSLALIFFLLGAPFVAVLEVIIYAGAIVVLFVFVVMMLNLGPQTVDQERRWFNLATWRGLVFIAGVLLVELIVALRLGFPQPLEVAEVTPTQVSLSLFGPYLLGVELASMLLLAGLVGAFHLGRREQQERPKV